MAQASAEESQKDAALAVGPMGEHRTVMATLRDNSANPGPLGLMAFGMTTVLLNIHNAGIYELNAMILAMGIFYGGIAQVIAGIMEWRKNSTFGMTAFLSYGLFWMSFAGLVLIPQMHFLTGAADLASTEKAMGFYLFMWGVFTLLMFVATLRINRALQTVFFTLTILFWLLAIRDWTGSTVVGHIAGWEGVVCGLSAMYASIAQIWNDAYGRVVAPLGVVKK